MKKNDKTTDPDGPRLSAGGRVKRWVIGRPRRAADSPELADVAQNSKPTETGLNILGIIGRLVLLIGGMIVLFVVLVWFVLGVTVAPTVQAGGSFWLVSRAPWVQGQAEPGQKVLAFPTPVERDLLSRFELLVSPDNGNVVATIVSNPYSNATRGADGFLYVNGVATPYQISEEAANNISNSYLAVCDAGPCEQGQIVAIPVDQVLGRAGINLSTSLTGVVGIGWYPAEPHAL